ncbi:histidine kinase [Hylemonella gracilis str. Niagara R]|uniref:histidine kinase n=1 Tax=Hylemonella gracilis str. Niagara R TaxID=1458275 RepID=A0A016XCT4_9BURK|nr:sensor histidine kinase [Hylemonella gracilis]EYC49909.1 histidine kinase [Hylemonella gracilis str. Niagara R]
MPYGKKLFQREQHSLFGEILDWMLTPLLILWPVSLILTWLVAQNIAGKPSDHALELQVRALAQHLHQQTSAGIAHTRFDPPMPARTLLHADATDTLYFQVLGTRQEFLSGDPGLPPAPAPQTQELIARPGLEPGLVVLRNGEFDGTPVRIASLWIALEPLASTDLAPAAGSPLALVQVAETLDKRSQLAAEIIKSVMLPQFAMLPLAVLLVWLALAQAIRPLDHLVGHIRARAPDDLSPLESRTVPLEVAPLVSSINDLLMRLKDSIAVQKRFLADAAHQLKTPLAGLRMQADLAQRDDASTENLRQSLRQIVRASTNATHTVNQLLALARAEGNGAALAQQPCDLAQITVEAMRDVVPLALEKHLDFGYDGPAPGTPGVLLDGNPTLLKELVRNLLDNAIKYTPSSPRHPGVVTARVLTESTDQVLLQVEDSGPGVPEAERGLIFQPFYRALGMQADGSGLGLSIAQEIARQHQARIEVDDLRPGQQPPGSRFTVRFTMRKTQAS